MDSHFGYAMRLYELPEKAGASPAAVKLPWSVALLHWYKDQDCFH